MKEAFQSINIQHAGERGGDLQVGLESGNAASPEEKSDASGNPLNWPQLSGERNGCAMILMGRRLGISRQSVSKPVSSQAFKKVSMIVFKFVEVFRIPIPVE